MNFACGNKFLDHFLCLAAGNEDPAHKTKLRFLLKLKL